MKHSLFIYFTRSLMFVSVLIVFSFFKCGGNNEEEQSEQTTVESTEETLNNDSNTESSSTCNICGREFNGRGYEEQTNGNFKELEYPYSNLLCSPSCARKASQNIDDVANKYGIDLNQ